MQKLKLGWRQANDLPIGAYFKTRRVDHDPSNRNHLLGDHRILGGGAAKNVACPRNELARPRRLRHIVVCAHAEPKNNIALFRFGGQHQNRGASQRAIPLDLGTDFDAVHPGQHQVQNDQVGAVTTAKDQSVFPVYSRQATKALCFKGQTQYLEEIVVVLDQKESLRGHREDSRDRMHRRLEDSMKFRWAAGRVSTQLLPVLS